MAQFQRVSVIQARKAIKSAGVLLDIRDRQSFARSHVAQAQALNDDTVASFIRQTAADTPIFILCYHGISSQRMARYLAEQGFNCVSSVDGGFDVWQQQFPGDICSIT